MSNRIPHWKCGLCGKDFIIHNPNEIEKITGLPQGGTWYYHCPKLTVKVGTNSYTISGTDPVGHEFHLGKPYWYDIRVKKAKKA